MTSKTSSRREFLAAMSAAAAGLIQSCRTAPVGTGIRTKPQEIGHLPNVVLILTDDQGYGDVGCFGARGFETPNLDRMAAEGMRFTNFYVSQAVCSASRASLLTGCYAERVGIQGALGPAARVGISSGEQTIAQLLKERGYATAIFGKWHLGHHPQFLPLQHGFDCYLGLPYSNDMWPVTYDGKPLAAGQKSAYPPLPLIRDNEKIAELWTLNDQSKLTTMYTEEALRFIDESQDRPFFLYVPHSMPHTPLAVSDKFKGKSLQGPYGDVIMEIDWSVGQILDRLKKYGLDANTLVIFASDNGPWLNFGRYAGSAGPLREGKGTMFEGGARVPCIMRWPERIPGGRICDNIAATIDLLPTISALCGAPQPANKIDGVNILPLLEGQPGANPREHYFYYYGRELRAVRQGRWKLFFPHKSRSYAGVEPRNDGFPGPYAEITTGLELYDLETDIGEKIDVAKDHPDIVAALQALAEEAREELGDALTSRKGKGVREPGRLPAPAPVTVAHAAIGSVVTLHPEPSMTYPGEGPSTLTNGRRGSLDFQDNQWLGFEGADFEAIVDLGREMPVKKITCGFLSEQNSWIFLPAGVDYALSTDGSIYQVVGAVEYPTVLDFGAKIEDASAGFDSTPARFVKVSIRSIGVCPPGHPGAGGKAWIFIDEIMVE